MSIGEGAARWLLEGEFELQDRAWAPLAISALLRQQRRTGGVFKHLANTFIRLGRTFEVVLGPNLLLHFFTLYTWIDQYEIGSREGRHDAEKDQGVAEQKRSPSFGWLTCSGVTGFWDVLCNSSIVF